MRLKSSQLSKWRADRLATSSGNCELCGLVVKRPVADHDHKSGLLRGCICAGCNSLLGRLENNAPRYGVNLTAFCAGLTQYLSKEPLSELHPSHRTPDEKKALARKRAKVRYSKIKARKLLEKS